ncbi:MAG: DUF2007 domain-containing protein [Pseudomonadota bacterium]
MEELFRTNDPALLSYATAMLTGEDIAVEVFDVHMSVLEGSLGFLPRRVMVPIEQADRARRILKDLSQDLGIDLGPGSDFWAGAKS